MSGSRIINTDRLELILLHPGYGGITAVVMVMTGALASFYPDDIKANLTTYFIVPHGSFSITATAFWFCVLMIGISLSGTQWAQSTANRRVREDLSKRANELRDAISRIESLPPENFLADFQRLIGRAVRSTIAGHSTSPAEPVDQAIRNVLGSILELVKSYDKREPPPCYCANIMIFRDHGDVLAQKPKPYAVKSGAENHLDYDGCLEVVADLSK